MAYLAKYTKQKRDRYHAEPAHRQAVLARNVAWRKANPEKMREYRNKWHAKNAERIQQKRKSWQETIKERVIAAYGGKCSCCSVMGKWFLTIDHINKRSSYPHRKRLRGWQLYRWLEIRGFPQDGFRCLCFNCNCARGILGYCPHERES